MQTPLARAAHYVGTPYRLRGRTRAGWDCWGCVSTLRGEIFDRPTPSWAETYSIEDGASAGRLASVVEGLIRERLSAWSPVPPRPGAVVLLTFFERPAHVGLMLTCRDFIHALHGCETVIDSTNEPRWRGRIRGFFDA